jgi:hypothetical protein
MFLGRNRPRFGPEYAQFLYIGCHGDREALFRSDKEPYSDRLSYTELASHLKQYAVAPISIWLGACDSSAAASAWSNTGTPVRYLLGFAQKVKEKLVVALLPELVSLVQAYFAQMKYKPKPFTGADFSTRLSK